MSYMTDLKHPIGLEADNECLAQLEICPKNDELSPPNCANDYDLIAIAMQIWPSLWQNKLLA